MLIANAKAQATNFTARKAPAGSVTLGEEAPEEQSDVFKKSITGAAYATGGALGGLALGAISGEVMSHLTKNEVFSTFGGGVGALGGAATSLALSLSDEKVSIPRTFGAWAGASVGATAGMSVMGGIGEGLAAHGASAYLGSHGALIGALGVGLLGAGSAFIGDDSKVGKIAKSAGQVGFGSVVGLTAGGLVQTMLSGTPELAPLAATFPVVAAATAGLIGVQNQVNKGWFHGDDAKVKSQALDVATKSAISGAAAFAVGSVVGGVGHVWTGAAAYTAILPALGAAVGAGVTAGALTKNKDLLDVAVTGGIAGAAGVAGDAVGRGLTALTGMPVFQMTGAVAGALTGMTTTLAAQGRMSEYTPAAIGGFTAGTVAGTLLGAGLTALTGHSAYQVAGSAIGAVAGLCAGLAGIAHGTPAAPATGAGEEAKA